MGWLLIALGFVLVAYVVEALIRVGRCAPIAPDEPLYPEDMSARPGWDEYAMGTRLEREVAPDISLDADAGIARDSVVLITCATVALLSLLIALALPEIP